MRVEGRAFCMALFTISAFILVIKVLVPTTVQIFVYGDVITLKQVPNNYMLFDITIVAIFSCILGISGSYLLFSENKSINEYGVTIQAHEASGDISSKEETPIASKTNTEVLLEVMKGNEPKIMKILLERGELNQTELAVRADVPKSTLSRTLSDLEKRGLIIRYENGMSKMIKLSDSFHKLS